MSIRLENVSVKFSDRTILNNLSIELLENEITFLLGVNGVGKTTLIRTIMGFEKKVCGKIYYNDIDIDKMTYKERSKMVAYIPQIIERRSSFRVLDFVCMGKNNDLSIFSKPSKKDIELAKNILEKLNIGYLENSYIDKISGGELQIVYLARTYMQNASYMVLDEPTASLDFSRQNDFLDILENFSKNYGYGCFLSTHNPNLAYEYADRILMIKNGNIFSDLKRTQTNYKDELKKSLTNLYEKEVKVITDDNKSLFYI